MSAHSPDSTRGAPRLGKRLRALRQQSGLTQRALAERLGISPSYLNLLEHDRRPVTTGLLLALARVLDVDLRALAAGGDARLVADLTDAFADPVFEDHPLTARELAEFAEASPDVARAVLRLHAAYAETRGALQALGSRVLEEGEVAGIERAADRSVGRARLASELVSDFIQRNGGHFPELEAEAERVWVDARLDGEDLFAGLARWLERAHGVRVRVLTVREMHGAVRRYDPARRELLLSEVLRRGSRNFQLAVQLGLLECSPLLARLAQDPELATDEARALGRVGLANYFAAAVLMPYAAFHRAAETERYDIELLGHRFRVGWEQTCHRLTTLRRPGAEGVPFYMVRVDLAGNISKKFSAAGIHFPRYSGLCALWNVHGAFLQPGRVRVQLSRLPDGRTVLAVGRTVQRHSGGYLTRDVLYAVGVGCDAADAHRVVYADGMDLSPRAPAIPIGVTCRLCDRTDCQARAFP
ncbi:MAG TPA: short-chain fatty acyl-CoA regulator family protein, partial [Gemmatimonadaceae bacterium]|nr:short-chain fatty acyl-CoA regulator family protein [Gemmatimonadaceae bacterium]